MFEKTADEFQALLPSVTVTIASVTSLDTVTKTVSLLCKHQLASLVARALTFSGSWSGDQLRSPLHRHRGQAQAHRKPSTHRGTA